MRPRLVTIPISHYCEKARWALDRARIDYDERRHLQVFHYLPAILAAGGISAPALRADGARLADSTDILRWVDAQLPPERRLYTSDEALALEERFDEELGPATRRVVYHHALAAPELMMPYNDAGAPGWERRLLAIAFRPAAGYLRWRLKISAAAADADLVIIRRIFDEVGARLADGRRFLVDDRFSAADLTFAALAAPAIVPAEYGIRLPPPDYLPAAYAALVRELRATPAGAFALRLYREERR